MAPQTDELGQQDDRRERDPQARQDDVKPECGRHLRTSRDHLTAGMRSSNHNRGIKTHYSSLKVPEGTAGLNGICPLRRRPARSRAD
jgi:hypothetical protein